MNIETIFSAIVTLPTMLFHSFHLKSKYQMYDFVEYIIHGLYFDFRISLRKAKWTYCGSVFM